MSFSLQCQECESELEADCSYKDFELVIKIKPCEKCMKDIQNAGYEEGWYDCEFSQAMTIEG
jgi:deoxycytidylate deaminase